MRVAQWGRVVFWGLVVLAGTLVVALIVTRGNRTIHAMSVVPGEAEVASGTAVVVDRRTVGSIADIAPPRWALTLYDRRNAPVLDWVPATLYPGSRWNTGGLELFLEDTAGHLDLHIDRAASHVIFVLTESGTWQSEEWRLAPSDTLRVNNRPYTQRSQGHRVTVLDGDIIQLGNPQVRLGRFGQVRVVHLDLATSRLCPRSTLTLQRWFPSDSAVWECRSRMLAGAARLKLSGAFGLTRPTLKLTPAYVADAIPDSVQDSVTISLLSSKGLQEGVEEMLAYLNAPADARPVPVTHFEHTVANLNDAVASVRDLAGGLSTTLRKDGGLEATLLEAGSRASLNRLLSSAADLSGRLTDPGGTLLQNAGLDPLVSDAQQTMDSVQAAILALRAQVDRVAPRVERAADGVTNSIDGLNAALASVKQAGEDITGAINGVKSMKAIVAGSVLLLPPVAAAIKELFEH